MASPGPDTSVLDPKAPDAAPDKEHKPDLNGHTPSPATAPEDAPAPAVEKPVGPAVESEPESRAEAQTEPKSDAEGTSEKPLVNGDGKPDKHEGPNGVATGDADTEHAAPESKPSASPTAVPAEDPEPTESEHAPEEEAAPSTKTPAIADPAADEKKTPDQPTDESATKSEDVEMTDATKPDESAASAPEPTAASELTPPAPAPDETLAPPAVKQPDSIEEPTRETDMAEKPLEETPSADKSKDADNAAPLSQDVVPTSEVDLHPASMSQLALETTETDVKTPETSIEVSMSDAPGKISREREDDAGDEPAPKRAKTEPKDEEPSVVTPAADSAVADTIAAKGPAQLDPDTLSTLPQWEDKEKDAQTITPYQRREMRRVMGRIKKTKHGHSFRDSVQKLWPQIWEGYVAKIEKPMDLAEVDRGLRDGAYATFGEFKQDLSLIYVNTLAFNGPAHEITGYALGAIRTTWEDVRRIPEEEPVKPKPAPKPKPVRESRAVASANINASSDTTARRQSAGPAASPAQDAAEVKQQPAAPQQPANLRRASTAPDGDRPKRTVRAPKPKDIDYSTKASRKKLKPELQFCEEVLAELMHSKNTSMNSWFLEPVDAEGLGIPHYYSMIKKPMDLNKVSRMLSSGDIASAKDFEKNVKLIFTNCYEFNGPPDQGNAVSGLAHQLEELYNSQMKGKDAWLAKHAKANARQASASNASDDEDEDAEEEGDAAPGVDPTKELKELEAKYHEESQKLNALIFTDNPVQSMIDIQQGILKVIQEAVVKARQSLTEYRQKQEKGGKKTAKASKAKASGGGGRKSTGNAAPAKKAGGSKKAAKKTLTPGDKDQIANAINDLEGNQLDRAIEIIKRDTGQNENTDGELELDIDQLSNEALLKLWELCKKVLPGFGKDSTANSKSSPEVNRSAPSKQASNANAPKPKKNKPMSAQEQEARIAALQSLRDLYKPGQEPPGQEAADSLGAGADAVAPAANSSEESSSEEE